MVTRTSLRCTKALAASVVACFALLLASCSTGPDAVVFGPCYVGQCDDGNPCTTESCSSTGDCKHAVRTGDCQDGNACTTGDHCVASVCTGVVFDCNDGFPCTVDSCDKSTGCVHLATQATVCEDGNGCTADSCDTVKGCVHEPNTALCNDGNPCTFGDACFGGACLPSGATMSCDDQNPCTNDACVPATGACAHSLNTHTCDDGNPCTHDDVCAANVCAGVVDCACALQLGQVLPAKDDCDTPFDDNCDGKINEQSTCGATLYRFNVKPDCGAVCYYDEPHDIAVSGKASDPSGFGTYATGQLLDGAKGGDDWSGDLGNGPGYEWVAWTSLTPIVFVQFAKPRNLTFVRLGLNNRKDGAVSQPPEIDLGFSMDGIKWTTALPFKLADGSEPAIADGKRGDIDLAFPLQTAKFVKISFVTPGSWTFVDELEFD